MKRINNKEDIMKTIIVVFIVIIFALSLSAVVFAKPVLEEKVVQYTAQGVTMKGYLAYDKNIKAKRPGILVVHEWWGLNEYARKRARMLAELGYTALAVDMYGEGKEAKHPDEAGKFSSELFKNFDIASARFLAAMDFLKKQDTVDQGQMAAIGYCFGGGVVLNMARQGVDLKGVVIFHGNLAAVKPAQPGSVKAKILVLHGADDKFTTAEQIESFKKEMKDAGVDFRFISYPGAVHGFTNPDADEYGKEFKMPLAYNEKADKESWMEMKDFLNTIFKK